MLNIKYRVREVAKDFGRPAKEIAGILEEYATAPKSNMQALNDKELALVFEYLTQKNQVSDLQASLHREPKPTQSETKPASTATPAKSGGGRKENGRRNAQGKSQQGGGQSAQGKSQQGGGQSAQGKSQQGGGQSAQGKSQQGGGQSAQGKSQQGGGQSAQGKSQQGGGQSAQGKSQQGGGQSAQGKSQQGGGQSAQGKSQQGGGQSAQGKSQQGGGQSAQGKSQQGGGQSAQGRSRQGGGQSSQGKSRQGGGQPSQGKSQQNGGSSGQGGGKSQQGAAQGRLQRGRVPEKKLVDTRKGGAVNLDKYDEKLERIASSKTRQMDAGREKFKNRASQRRASFGGSKRRQEEQEKMRRLQLEVAKKTPVTVKIPDEIAVGELASRMKKTGAEVVKALIKNGVMASVSDIIDFDTAAIIAEDMGCKVEKEVIVTIEERLIDTAEDKDEDLLPRAPVVVVMGHVDHGKTSLLDYIRNAHVTEGEAGGITQHIGAYQVTVHQKPITFLDTPGHEAFTAMRARGAMITDIAILVVAADDGIMPQTVESINHAKAAEIPIIVAINKMDKPDANPQRVMEQLTKYELVPEEWGGDVICCPISAKTGEGIDNLLEMVNLTAEMRELKANPNRSAHGAVVEARLDKGRGPVATLLVQNGTLHQGDVIIAGSAVGRVRAMTNAQGEKVETAAPSVPVEIIGMAEVPEAGDDFHAVADERMARELAEQRKHDQKAAATNTQGKVTLEDLFSQIQQGEMKTLNIIVKADVQGSAEAVKASLEKISNDEVRVRVIHSAVGAISDSDVMLANTSNAIIVGFNVRPDASAKTSAQREHVDIRMYRVIYDCIGEIEQAMKGMLSPKFQEVELGTAEVREVYKITGAGIIAGSYVTSGRVVRSAQVRLVRDGIVIHEGLLASLRRFKDDVKEVAQGYECGIGIEKYSDIKVGDVLECFETQQIQSE